MVVAVLLGLLLLGSFRVKPVWRWVKERRALTFVANARAAMATNNFAVSVAHLRAAHELSPFHPDVLRATGEHFSRLSRPEGLVYWRQLDDSGQMTDSDRMSYVRLALDHGAYESASTAILPLEKTRPNDPEALKMLSELYLAGGEPDQAAALLAQAMDRAPFRTDLQILLSQIELAGTNRVQWSRAKARLFQIVTVSSTNRAAAALALLQVGQLESPELRLLSTLVKPAKGDPQELWLAHLVARVRQDRTMLPDAVQTFRLGTGLTETGAEFQQALTRLVALEEYPLVTNLVSPEVVTRNRDLYPFRLEALAGLRDAAGLESVLKVLQEKMPKGQSALYRALSASFQGRTNETALLWQAAITENRGDYRVLKVVAQRAEAEKMTAAAVEVWEILLLQSNWAAQAAAQLIRLTANSTDPRPTLAAYRRLTAMQPTRSDLQLHLNFYRLLLNAETDAAAEFLARGRQPEHARALWAVTEALAGLRRHDADRALRALESASIAWESAPRTWRVVRAAALAGVGQTGLARRVVETLDFNQMGPRELELLGQLNEKADR